MRGCHSHTLPMVLRYAPQRLLSGSRSSRHDLDVSARSVTRRRAAAMLSELSQSIGERAARRLGIQRRDGPGGHQPVPLGQRKQREVYATTITSLKRLDLLTTSTKRTDCMWTNAARYIIGEPRFRVPHDDRSRRKAFRQCATRRGIGARSAARWSDQRRRSSQSSVTRSSRPVKPGSTGAPYRQLAVSQSPITAE